MKACVDFHSHILPEVDDGSQSVRESLELLRMEAEQGITHVVATPHFYANHDSPERFLRRRNAAWEKLREAMDSGLPEVTLGAEVYYFPGISDSQVLPMLTVGERPFVMLEMPTAPWTEHMYREIRAIHDKHGITPIIAHVDRYISPLRTHGILKRLEELPVLVQANGEFFLRSGTAAMALRLLREDRIHLLGSDCHNLKTRKPDLGDAFGRIEKRLGPALLERLRGYEARVLGE